MCTFEDAHMCWEARDVWGRMRVHVIDWLRDRPLGIEVSDIVIYLESGAVGGVSMKVAIRALLYGIQCDDLQWAEGGRVKLTDRAYVGGGG